LYSAGKSNCFERHVQPPNAGGRDRGNQRSSCGLKGEDSGGQQQRVLITDLEEVSCTKDVVNSIESLRHLGKGSVKGEDMIAIGPNERGEGGREGCSTRLRGKLTRRGQRGELDYAKRKQCETGRKIAKS